MHALDLKSTDQPDICFPVRLLTEIRIAINCNCL